MGSSWAVRKSYSVWCTAHRPIYGMDAYPSTSLPAGAILVVLERTRGDGAVGAGTWCKVVDTSGSVGWVSDTVFDDDVLEELPTRCTMDEDEIEEERHD